MSYVSKSIEYGLYLFVFLLPWQTRWIIRPGRLNNGPWEYGSLNLYGTDMLLIIILFLFVIYIFLERKITNYELPAYRTGRRITNLIQNTIRQLADKIQIFFLSGLILTAAVSIFFAPARLLALYKLGWLALGLGLFWLLRQANYNRLKLIWSLLLGLGLEAGLGAWQFLSQSTFSNKWLGLALHQSAAPGTAVIETMGLDGVGERWLRAYGGLDHPNVLGGIMIIALLLLINEVMRLNKIKNFQFSIFNFQLIFNVIIFKILSWILLLVFSMALFFSFSRAGWLALGAGLMVLIIANLVKMDWLKQKILAQAVLIMGSLAFILFLIYPNLVMTRLYAASGAAAGRLEIKSASERAESLKNSLAIINNNWVFGAGPGNYTLALKEELKPNEPSYFYQPVHNAFLLVWSEIGIAGLLFFTGLIAYLIIFNIRKNGNNANYDISLSILIAMIILMVFDHWLWSLHFGVLFFWLALGLASLQAEAKIGII